MPLYVVGTRFADSTKSYIERLGLTEDIVFLGSVSTTELSGYLTGAEALLMPSTEEGFGLPALEAMACETMVLGTPVAALKEVCGDSAWFSEDFTAEAFSRILLRSLENQEERRDKISKGLERMRRFSLPSVARKTCGVYRRVLSRSGQERSFLRTSLSDDTSSKTNQLSTKIEMSSS